jgi:hypothetical protein
MRIEPEHIIESRHCLHARPHQACLPLEIASSLRRVPPSQRRHTARGDRP